MFSKFAEVFCRSYSKNVISAKASKEYFIRNIGILAHIDAGKTTTTERMLYYSGTINKMGEVHHGNTVTDFMDQERRRGITITAASVTFSWGDYTINLIDTPGHIDFTMEVEQTLNVLDGAVIVLDGTAGVEAQTSTVWSQACRYEIPRIIYINKMDRPNAGLSFNLDSIKSKLTETPLPLQLPFFQGQCFKGIVDVLTMELYIWDDESLGMKITHRPLSETDEKLWDDALKLRISVTETLADLDDDLAERILTDDLPLDSVPTSLIHTSVRKVTQLNQAFPVLCGSSFKNIGVQALMDATTMYLPSPVTRQESKLIASFRSNLSAKAFKVRHDPHKGPLTFLRIFSGQIKKGQKVYNLRMSGFEQAAKLYVPYADEYTQVDEIGTGAIIAVSGFKDTMTGDLLTSSATVAASVKKCLSNDAIQEITITPPIPVFFCSIECPSQAFQATLDRALAELSREDPSLRVRIDSETGQTVLSGMGELHLDVIKERIRQEYKVNVQLGPLQIAYKEALMSSVRDSFAVDMKIGSSHQSVSMTMSLSICDSPPDDVALDRSPEAAPNISCLHPRHLIALKSGVRSALTRGPLLSCPVINGKVTLHRLEVKRGTSDSVISSAASQCIKKLMAAAGTQLMEPVMEVNVDCPTELMSPVVADLGRRRAAIHQFLAHPTHKIVVAYVPLAELLGYATFLRSLTSGLATFSMRFYSLQRMSAIDEKKAIRTVTGLDPQ